MWARQAGSKVVIQSGNFQDFEAEIKHWDWIRQGWFVYITLFGQRTLVSVSDAEIRQMGMEYYSFEYGCVGGLDTDYPFLLALYLAQLANEENQ